MDRNTYEAMRRAGHAGPGRPLDPEAYGVWYMALEGGRTVLYTGVELVDCGICDDRGCEFCPAAPSMRIGSSIDGARMLAERIAENQSQA